MNEDDVHSVKVTFEPVSEEELEQLLREDERLNALFGDPAVVDYDPMNAGNKTSPCIFAERTRTLWLH